ncbi:GNAT family N-acetyltransferase [Bdellovibrio sp. SKB1291214]|uniref:GNAT family N-acetyltransferase n=1 Tax=Bdellovibrio sp. SKB1291214 TaxID=1732569 RepID=UPI000B51E53C|nr:GNAT family protein [Bdellovibrio sp. SKB1291214]UYL07544.1 GNAT family N-acetyltransferase [Bdellovibrio sp. SKB1291214]
MKSTTVPLFKKTERLILRPLDIHDYENWAQAYSSMRPPQNQWDEANWIESELTKPKFKGMLKSELHHRAEDRVYRFGVFRRDDGMLLGEVFIGKILRHTLQTGIIGYRIFNNFWKQGYATEACAAALQIAFKDLRLHRIEAHVEPTNKASIKVAKRIGLKKEGISPKKIFDDGKWRDMINFAATCEDYGIKYKFPPKSK